MKNLDANFILEKNKQTIQPIRLYTIHDIDNAGLNLYLCEEAENVTFDGQEYVAKGVRFDTITEHSGGEVDEVRVSIQNIDRQVEAYLQSPNYRFKGKKITITYVWRNHLDDPDNKYQEIFYIDSYESNAIQATFTLSGKIDVMQVMLPKNTVLRTNCEWRFKGTECKYAGSETTCNRTLQRCRELENTLNYGGFPAAGGKRMFV